MKDTHNSFYSKTDFMILLLGFVLFLVTVLLPTHLGYFTYSSDARITYEHQGFQILDALHTGQLPLWDPYNANGREGTCLSVGMGAFAPDLLLASWIVDKVLPNTGNLSTLDKSFLVNLLFRHFLIFGIGTWFLGTLLFRTRTALYFFWFVTVFGTPVIMLLNSQLLSQMLIYFPWILFCLLKFATTKAFWSLIGFSFSLATSFLALGRDFPLLLFAVFVAGCVTVVVFWPRLSEIKFSSFSKRQWVVGIIALLALLVLISSLKDVGQQFLSSFSKKRFPKGIIMDVPLSAEVDQSAILMGEFLPDLKSLMFPFPIATMHYGHYHPAHSYLFMGLSGFTLLLFCFPGRSRKMSYFFIFLGLIYFLSAYWRNFPLFTLLKEIIPGFKFYVYPFHLKYLILFSLVALEGIGLDNLILEPRKKKKIILASVILLCLINLVLAWKYFGLIKQACSYKIDPLYRLIPILFIYGTFAVILVRCLLAFSLLKLMNRKGIRKWSAVLIASETLIAILFLFTGRGVSEAGLVPIRSDPMYFLKYRPNNFTLHAIDPSELGYYEREILCLGTVYKCNFAKDERLRMNGQANLYRMLHLQQRENLLGGDSSRLFLARKVKISPEEMLMETLNSSSHFSIREVPVIVDEGDLPLGLPLLQAGEMSPQTTDNIKFVQVSIPRSSMKVETLPGRDGWSKITVKGMGFSRHLSTNPYIMKQEQLSCYLNGKKLSGNWFLENLENSSLAAFELNKSGPDILEVVAPLRPDRIERLKLKYRDAGGIHVDDFGYNHLDLTYNAEGGRVLVYLDSYAQGWKATIDGNKTPIMRAYGAYKALLVPAGTHKVSFRYHPERIISKWEFAFGSYILLLTLFVSSFFISKFYNPTRS